MDNKEMETLITDIDGNRKGILRKGIMPVP